VLLDRELADGGDTGVVNLDFVGARAGCPSAIDNTAPAKALSFG